MRIANERIANKRIANERIANERIANERIANKRIANERIANERIANKRMGEWCMTMTARPTSYESWEQSVPPWIRESPLWNMVVYRKALFLYDLVWFDCEKLEKDRRGRAIEEQIIRSAGSICANIEEGYGRGLGRDYARFLGYALGSARETQGWYHRARHLLSEQVLEHRLAWLDEIIALLVTTTTQQKAKRPK